MMIITILVAFFSLIALLVIHEFGHFILAKKFGTKVEEFGVGYPPRVFGVKFGETIYSLNLIPFGAFVKILGEEGGIEDYHSFVGKPLWQRFLIIIGGVVSFWIVSAVLLSIVAGVWGLPMSVADDDNYRLEDVKVQVAQVVENSPAWEADLKTGDIILGFEKVEDVRNFVSENAGKEINLTVKRGQDLFDKAVTPRISYPEGEGATGIILTRIGLRQYSWYEAPVQGIAACGSITANIVNGWGLGLKNLFGMAELPEGLKMEMFGPIGILDLLRQYSQMGINYFLFLVSFISIAMALANILPIPALDGGKVVFLAIEWLRGKPINCKIEQKVTASFFILLIIFMVFVTIKFDIPRLF